MLSKLLKKGARQQGTTLLPAMRLSSLGFNCGASLHTHSFRAPLLPPSCSSTTMGPATNASYLNPTTVKKPTKHPSSPKPSSLEHSLDSHKFLSSLPTPKYSHDPFSDFASSILDMIIAHNLDDASDLEHLYHCYLELNEPKHHSTIRDAFLTSITSLNLVE
ncbi:hypothetical protein L7F22_036129 [Adiantum nelumboides]|nr:hypothetical protein [Adiantum nelumboides]